MYFGKLEAEGPYRAMLLEYVADGPPATDIGAAEAANDEPTADLLTQRMQVHEKNAWMLRSMVA